jgi:hypothetical protein
MAVSCRLHYVSVLTRGVLSLQGVRVHPHRVVRQQGGREEPASQAEAGAELSGSTLVSRTAPAGQQCVLWQPHARCNVGIVAVA